MVMQNRMIGKNRGLNMYFNEKMYLMKVQRQFHGMRRLKERGDQGRVKLVLRQTPNIMVSQVIQVTPEGESTRQGCKRR